MELINGRGGLPGVCSAMQDSLTADCGSADRVCVIGIAGGSGSGKTTFSGRLISGLGEDRVAHVSQDRYYRDASDLSLDQRRLRNYDHPSAIDSQLLADHLRLLRDGRAVDVPCYDFATHTRLAGSNHVPPRPIVIVEGILLLSLWELRRYLTLRVYVDAAADTRLLRRIRRDTLERGRDLPSVLEQWETSVQPMHERYVEPSRRWADVMIADGGGREAALRMLLDSLRRMTLRV